MTGLTTGQNFIVATAASGRVPVTVSKATVLNTAAAPLSTNSYAVIVGTGSTATSISATYVALFKSVASAISFSGTVSGATASGIDVRSSVYGVVPVMVSAATVSSGSLATGTLVTVSGIGTGASGVYAQRISGSASATPTAAPTAEASATATAGVPKRLLTADYFGTPYGTTAVSAAAAAPYLSWAQTGVTNVDDIRAYGIKTEVYTNPNRVQSHDPLYSMTASSGFATTCGASRVYNQFAGNTQYVTNPASSALHASYASLVRANTGNSDAVFEDNAGPLSDFGTSSFKAAMPCAYSDTAWLTGERALEASAGKPTIFNGLSGLSGHNPSPSIGLLDNSSTIGGTYEHCLSDDAKPEYANWVWQATENTQIQVVAKHKYFFCMARNLNAASSNAPARIYVLASLLLTYDPNYTVLWDEFSTPNGFHILPESGFVALQPLHAQPTNISQLATSGGVYVREYAACYYRGALVGKCAAVVNGDYYSHTRPTMTGYTHTLAVSGNDVLEGGTVSYRGAMPPMTMPAGSASILLP